MKKQVSKGPVDLVTSEARFSLSEDKLIRQQLDYQQMVQQRSISPSFLKISWSIIIDKSIDKLIVCNLLLQEIFVTDLHEFSSPIPVRVLDCDTISQVKEKILDVLYKHVPHSSRPVKDDVDLGMSLLMKKME